MRLTTLDGMFHQETRRLFVTAQAVNAIERFARAWGWPVYVREVRRRLCAHRYIPKQWWLVPTRYELAELAEENARYAWLPMP